ncbi:MAG: DNA methyltransferase, partial [Candidatus Micrarchaeaceae archaeon]
MRLSNHEVKKFDVRFRDMIPEIPTTTYGTFGIFRYPAKFIPQVVAYAIKKYCKPGMRVFDPFAGYGTVGVVSRIYGHDYILWDINPMLSVIHDTAIMTVKKIDINKIMNDIKASKEEFIPKWSNLTYWFPEDFLPLLSRTWGFAHSLADDTKYLLLIPLLKVTRYFSYSDEKMHKLFRSRYSKIKVEKLLKGDWKAKFYSMLQKEIVTLVTKIEEYNRLRPKAVEYDVKAGVD